MAEKQIQTRIQHKRGTAEDWSKSSLKPKEGELIIYLADSTHPYDRFKIGDGITVVSELPFASGSDIRAGANVSITNNADGSFTIAATDTNTTYSVATTSADGLLSKSDKNKLDGIAAGAEANVQSDWNAISGDALILNKPTIPTKTSQLTNDSGFKTTDSKVTSAANHYDPVADTNAALAVDASSTTAATWDSTSLVTGVNIQRDAKGHVTGLTLDSIKIPANPVSASAIKTALGTGTGTTKFLREDGTWVVPPDTNTDTKVTQTATEPTTKNTNWYLLSSTSKSDNTDSVVKNNDIRIQAWAGTTSETGEIEMILGNSTASETDGNKQGFITLYSPGSSYHMLKTTSTSSAITHTFPAKTGTVAHQPTINTTFATSLTPADNTIYEWTMTGNLTINATTNTVCPYYGSHIILTTGSAARTLTINAVAISGDVATSLPASTQWELSILRGRVIMAQTV